MAKDRRPEDDSQATTQIGEDGITRPTVDVDPASPTWGIPRRAQPTPARQAGVQAATPAAGSQAATRPAGSQAARRPAAVQAGGFGRYQIEGPINSGGMGTVFAARDPQLNRRVALKRVHIQGGERRATQARMRLQREAQAMAKMSHPNVITVYDVGVADDGDLFVAMELVEGETLRHWLEGQRTLDEILDVFAQAGRGLGAAHRAGIVHRDFKPDNVMVASDDRVRVLDFGLAWAAESDDEDPVNRRHSRPGSMGDYVEAVQAGEEDGAGDGLRSPNARAGAIAATPLYMAPEQHLGRSADAASDQFSFCVALYQAVYDRHPFGETYEEIRAAVVGGKLRPPPRDSNVPEHVFKILARGMHLRAGQRFSSMNALLAELEPEGCASAASSRSPVARAIGWLFALLVVGGLGAGGWMAYQRGYLNKYLQKVAPSTVTCPDSADALAGIWDSKSQETIRQAFNASGSAIAEPTHARIQAVLDSYTGSWISLHDEACERTRPVSEADYRAQQSCLMRLQERLRGLVIRLQTGETAVIEGAVSSCLTLPPVELCADVESLRQGAQPPDPGARDQVESLRRELMEIEALSGTPGGGASLAELVERAQGVVGKARAVDYMPVTAESLLRLGALQWQDQHLQESRKTLEEAVLVAEESSHREALALALVELTHVTAALSPDDIADDTNDDIAELDRRARAAIAHHDARDAELTGRLDIIRARRLADRGDLAQATEITEAAIKRYRENGRSHPLRVAHGLELLASWYLALGRRDDAVQRSSDGLALYVEQLGEGHPEVVMATQRHAEVLRQAGKYDEARKTLSETDPFWETPRGKIIAARYASERPEPAREPRSITVRVVDPNGRPAVGAEVVIGTALLPDGKYLSGAYSFEKRARNLLVRGTADERGEVVLEGPWSGLELVVAAEKDDLGRSLPVAVSERSDRTRVRLAPWGRLEGTITVSGDAPRTTVARVAAWDGPDAVGPGLVIQTLADGSYAVERLPAGRYSVQAQVSFGPRIVRIEPSEVRIRPDRTVRGDVAITGYGDGEGVTLKIELSAPVEGSIEHTLALVTPGRWRPRNMARALRELPDRLQRYGLIQSKSSGGGPIVLAGVQPGSYTLCVEPVRGDVRDPDFVQILRVPAEQIEMHCETARVKREPAEQAVTVTIETLPQLREPGTP